MATKPRVKILWAVDALSGDLQMLKKTAKLLDLMSRKVDCEVEPVCVFTPPNPYLERRGLSNLLRQTEEEVKKRLDGMLAKAPLKSPVVVAEPHFISQPTFSVRQAVTKLSDYARECGAELIVASSHARSGLSRALMGSFVETLVHLSAVPVLVATTNTRTPTAFKNILFPSDLSDESRAVFARLLPFAKAFGSTVTIYHKLQWATDYVALFTSVPLYSQYVEEDGKARAARGEEFVSLAKVEGVKATVVVDKKGDGIADAIAKYAKKTHPSLVALTSDTGPVASVLLGSITRAIMRKVPSPVWVLKSPKNV
ncbi:MAG: universal stress protein [Bdellovibrionales bacterium]|nr:universal stress protein [Bdellovibrionales bacterium]